MEITEKTILEMSKSGIKNRRDFDCFKRKMAEKHKVKCQKNILLLQAYHKLVKEKRVKPQETIEALLQTRPVRSLSGVVNVSVLTKPWACGGKCLFCPSQKNIPKSYLEKEPAVQRALLNKFNPYKQVLCRLESLQATGHSTDKVEIRIVGGTWHHYPSRYRLWFVKECFRACNEFKIPARSAPAKIFQEQRKNEKAKSRIVGLSIETRPDCINKKEVASMRALGITKVELGVQSIFNDVLAFNRRGHTVETTIKATQLLKEAGFKVSYQIMPNLPKSNPRKDLLMAKELFSNPSFKPDSLKIYPMALVESAGVYRLYKQGKYKPLEKQELIQLLSEIKRQVPYWCRIERVARDIPSNQIIAGGAKMSNIREEVKKRIAAPCKCIKCREVGAFFEKKEKVYLFQDEYSASLGKEIFLCLENKERTKLLALLRLRFNGKPNNTAFVREVRTFGPAIALGKKGAIQHRGLGKKLIKKAEGIAKKRGCKKIAVISGIGVRPYYRKLGYRLQNTYMAKQLN